MGWKGLLETMGLQPRCRAQGHPPLAQVAQSPISAGSGRSQGWGSAEAAGRCQSVSLDTGSILLWGCGVWRAPGGREAGRAGLPARLQAGRILQGVSQLLLSALPSGPRAGSWQVARRCGMGMVQCPGSVGRCVSEASVPADCVWHLVTHR